MSESERKTRFELIRSILEHHTNRYCDKAMIKGLHEELGTKRYSELLEIKAHLDTGKRLPEDFYTM